MANLLPSTWLGYAAAPVAILAVLTVRFLLQTRRPHGFPPGPPPVLGLGNLHQVPPDKPYLKFHEWSQTYGDIIGLKMGPKNFVILCNPAHVRELFGKRGAKYSGRPYSAVPMEHVVKPPDQHLLFLPYDGFLKRWRAAVRHMLSPDGVARLGPLQSAMGDRLVYDLLQKPTAWGECIWKWGLEAPMLAIAGQKVDDYGPGFADHYLKVQHEWMHILEPSNTPPVEVFPFLAYVPAYFAEWKRRARWVRKGMYQVYFKTLDAAKERAAKGQGFETLFAHILRRRDNEEKMAFTDSQLAFMGGGLLDGAIDTTLSSFESFILCMTAHEDVRKRVQAEIEEVCGGKCPQSSDVKNMPYLTACMLEVFRWRGAANVGLPHSLEEDDVFEGYTIPKGTTILACAYSIHLRSDDYENPNEFNPDRYMDNPYGTKYQPSEEEGRKVTYTFGSGRRVCPGDEFAKMIILTTVAKLLWAFDFETEGAPDLSWETGYKSGLTNPPQNFRPTVRPRSARRAEEIVEEHQKAEEYMAKVLA